MTKSAKRRLGRAYLRDAEAEAFRVQIAASPGEAVENLCHAHDLYARGCMLIEPINPTTEQELLAEQKRIGNVVTAARQKFKKSLQ